MKSKLFLISVGLAALLTGCNNENDIGFATSGEHVTSFRVELSGKTTRAQNDTYTPTRYVMEVYTGTAAFGTPFKHVEQTTGTFDVSLTYGTEYTCLFWADNGTPDDVVNDEYETADLKAVKVKSDACPSNPAFGGMARVTAGVSAQDAYSVTLNHAVAKVEYIQTEPLTAADNTLTVTFPNTFSLNLNDWSTTEIADVTYTHTFTGIAKVEIETVIATSYVIASSENATLQTLTVKLNTEDDKLISNVPLQRNFKTALKGSFSNLYEADMACSLTQEWDTPENEKELISVWDGTTTTEPANYNANSPGDLTISSAAELAWLAVQSNASNQKDFNGYTFTLTTDIDLNGHLWPQIGHFGEDNEGGFRGTLDGNGHHVRGVNVSNEVNGTEEVFAGFIHRLNFGTVKNLTVRGCVNARYMKTTARGKLGFGGIAGYAYESIIEQCHNACDLSTSADNDPETGGIAGYAYNTTIHNCVNSGTVQSTGEENHIGGIVGNLETRSNGKSILEGNTNEGTIKVYSSTKYAYMGGIAGYVNCVNHIDIDYNTNKGQVSYTTGQSGSFIPEIGGIIGRIETYDMEEQNVETNLLGNKNEGTLTSDESYAKIGGIIGIAAPMSTHSLRLTENQYANGIPANIAVGWYYKNGSLTVDGNTVTEAGPYPNL